MTIDSVIAPDLLSAEIEAIEDLLVHYEDWRALTQLELRERQGEVPSNLSASGIKVMLIEKLAANPLFLRRQTLLKELERLTQSVHTPAQPITVRKRMHGDGDDLTRIRGIDTRLERRLNALNVRSFGQIASFTLDDVRYVSSTLGLDNRIISQMWIEQAELLASSGQTTAHANEPRFEPAPRAPVAAPPIPPADVAATHGFQVNESPPPVAKVTTAAAAPQAKSATTQPPVAPAPVAPPAVAVQASLPQVREARSEPPKVPVAPAQPQAPARPPVADAGISTAKASSETTSNEKTGGDKSKTGDERGRDDQTKPAAPAASPAAEAAPATASKTATPPAPVAEPDYSHLVPPAPIPARAFKSEYRDEPVPVSATVYAALTPASPLPARKYTGAIIEPVDHGLLSGASPPPKPRAAAAYAPLLPAEAPVSTPEPAQVSSRPVLRPDVAATLPSPVRTEAVPAGALAAKLAAAPAAKFMIGVEEKKQGAADVVETLPALPLKPATSAPPAQLPRNTAPPPPMSTHGGGPIIAPAAQPSPAVVAATAAAREAAMLAAAAARAPVQNPAARAPPPLPPAQDRMPQKFTANVPQQRPDAMPPSMKAPHQAPPAARAPAPSVEESNRDDSNRVNAYGAANEPRQGLGSPEARVTIRRSDEITSGPVLRSPGATEVHLGREQRRQQTQFDSSSYAAYHSEVHEASVQIVRRKDTGTEPQRAAPVPPVHIPANMPAAPPSGLATATQAPPANPVTPGNVQAAEKTAAPFGRFLKALTGQ